MTDWSHRDAYARVASEADSQWGEGGLNAGFDCVPASFALVVMVLGGPMLSVPDIVAAAYGSSFHGPTSFPQVETEIRKRWPGLPAITYGQPDDTLAAIDVAGCARTPVISTFHSSAGGTIVDHATGFTHVCPVVAHAGHAVTVLNVEHNTWVSLNEGVFRAATSGSGAGDLAVFNRVIGAP